jgi:hypothetical protein
MLQVYKLFNNIISSQDKYVPLGYQQMHTMGYICPFQPLKVNASRRESFTLYISDHQLYARGHRGAREDFLQISYIFNSKKNDPKQYFPLI